MKKLKLTIKHKFILVAVLAFASMLGILGLGQYTASELKTFGDVSLAISKVESDMLMLRRNEKDFLARNAIKYQGKFNKNFTSLQEDTSILLKSMSKRNLDSVLA